MTALETAPQQMRRFMCGDSLVVGLLAAGHFLLCCYLSCTVSLGIDEAYTLSSTAEGPAHAYRQALHFELQPPAYFVSLSLWRVAGSSLLVARLFSVCCTTAALIALAGISRRFLSGVHPGWVVSAAAFNPAILYAASEARCYALVVLLGTLQILLFHDCFLRESVSRWKRLAFCACALAGLLTFYFLGFALVGLACGLVAMRRWGALRTYFACMLCVGTLFVPQALNVSRQVTDHTATVFHRPGVVESVRYVSWQMRDLILPSDWEPLPDSSRWVWVIVGCLWLLLGFRFRTLLRLQSHWSCYSLVVVMFGFYLLAAQLMGIELLSARHMMPWFVPLLLGTVFMAWEAGGRRGVAAWCLLIIALSGATDWLRFHRLAKQGDWERVTAYIMRNEKAGEPIVLFKAPAELGVRHYYSGANVLVPVPAPVTFDRLNVAGYVLHTSDAVGTPVAKAGPHHSGLWVVRYGTHSNRDLQFGVEHLDAYLSDGYERVEVQEFFGSTVERYRVREPRRTVDSGDADRTEQSLSSVSPPALRGPLAY